MFSSEAICKLVWVSVKMIQMNHAKWSCIYKRQQALMQYWNVIKMKSIYQHITAKSVRVLWLSLQDMHWCMLTHCSVMKMQFYIFSFEKLTFLDTKMTSFCTKYGKCTWPVLMEIHWYCMLNSTAFILTEGWCVYLVQHTIKASNCVTHLSAPNGFRGISIILASIYHVPQLTEQTLYW